MVDGVDEADPHVGVVVRHQNDVEQLLALRVQLPQASVHRLQGLSGHSGASAGNAARRGLPVERASA